MFVFFVTAHPSFRARSTSDESRDLSTAAHYLAKSRVLQCRDLSRRCAPSGWPRSV